MHPILSMIFQPHHKQLLFFVVKLFPSPTFSITS
nr:MAG TPA: hypothetical protein [Caudoviricetes sp.]DAJ49958.1 MAG TPA: hypothetical protein [Caudoviricetes sp.]